MQIQRKEGWMTVLVDRNEKRREQKTVILPFPLVM